MRLSPPHRRGAALLVVLLCLAVVTAMTTALLVMNQSSLGALQGAEAERVAQATVSSAIAFCRYRLEHQQSWGQESFTHQWLTANGDGVDFQVEQMGCAQEDLHKLAGRFVADPKSGLSARFEVELRNRLDLDVPTDGVPRDSCSLRVTANCRGFVSRCDVLYRGEPLYDAALTANRDINLGLYNTDVSVASTDPERNWLRANGNIVLNRFLHPPSDDPNQRTVMSSAQGKGVMWSKSEIKSGNQVLEGDELTLANRAVNGILAPHARINHDIYQLQLSDLAGLCPNTGRVNLPAGEYELTHGQITSRNSRGQTSASNVSAIKYTRGTYKIIYMDSAASDLVEDADRNNTVTLPADWQNCPVVRAGADHQVNLTAAIVANSAEPANGTYESDTTVPGLKFNFGTGEFVSDVRNDTINCSGDLIIRSENLLSPQALNLTPPPRPGDTGTPATGVLKVTGDLRTSCAVRGGGAILASGDISIASFLANSNVDAEEKPVVLYGNNVGVLAGSPGVTNADGSQNTTQSTMLTFRGVIYARGGVSFYGGATYDVVAQRFIFNSDGQIGRLTLDGAVVAQTETIAVSNCAHVDIRYNPAYLTQLTYGLYSQGRRANMRRLTEATCHYY